MSEQLDFALNLVNEFSGPAEAGAKSALALAGAILQAERAEQSFQRALDKEDRVGALAARLSKATAEQKIASLNAPAAARPGMSAGVAERVGALTGEGASGDMLSRAGAILRVESAQRALNKAQADGDPLRVLQATLGLRTAQDALADKTDKVQSSFSRLRTTLSSYGGTAAIAIGAATTAIGALIGAGTALALHGADEKRSLQLTLEAMLGSAEAGEAMEEQFQALAKTVPTSREAIDDMGKALIRAGLTGDELARTLRSLATVESTAGAEGAGKLQNMIEKWNIVGHFEEPPAKALIGTGVTLDLLYGTLAEKTGKGVEELKALMKAGKITTEQGIDALNTAIGSKLGDVATKKLLGIGVQWTKFKESVGNLFEDSFGDGLEPLLEKMHDFLMLFDDSTESGKTLKFLLGEIFGMGGDATVSALGLLKGIIQGVEIGFLEAYIALKPLRDAWHELLGEDPGGLDETFTAIGVGVAYAITGVALLTAAVLAIPFAVGYGFSWLIEQFSKLPDTMIILWNGIADWWANLSFADMGAALVDGLVSGITGGAARVWDAITSLGTGSKTAMAESIDAHSPSEDFKRFGLFMAQGTAMGVDMGAQGVNDSVSSMVAPPSVASAGGGGGPVSVVLNFEVGPGAKASDAEAIADVVLARVTSAFENAGLSLGESAAA